MKAEQSNESEKTNEKVKLDAENRQFDQCFDEIDLEWTSTEEKYMMRSMFDD